MAGRYFGIPFATTGDRITVPDATQPDGSVSFTQGFGFDYERPNTDPAYKPVPRDGTNGLFHDITEALGIAQRQGVSDWTVDAQPYPINALVRHTDKVWRSLVANNNVTPVEGANWTELSTVPQATEAVAGIIEIATNAQAQAGTDTTKAVTPAALAAAFGGVNQGLIENGYQKFPSGLIIQWGSTASFDHSGSASQSVTFPVAFPAACLKLMVSHSSVAYTVGWTSVSTTGATIDSRLVAGTGRGPVHYFVIGY